MNPRQSSSVADLREQLRQCHERHLIHKLAPRFWAARAIMALEVLVAIVLVSWLEDRSLTAQAIEATGRQGWLLVLGTGLSCFIALADVVVNDLMPDRFTMPTALSLRHIGFAGLALQLGALGFLVVFVNGFSVLVLVYWLNAALSAGLIYLDAFARYRTHRSS